MIKSFCIVFLSLFLLVGTASRADEGMWLPLLLKQLNEGDMQRLGLKLTAEDIYNINQSSMKDAIVHFGGFCTGEMVSADGLILTNHHCGFDAIQSNSSVENDYITKGFWAMTRDQELPNPGLYVRFLVRIEDVTAKVKSQLSDTLSEASRTSALQKIYAQIAKEAKGDTHYETDVKPFFNGNEFYLFVYEKFNDVRLVGAPPESIGSFGGDTDNWMWPRHTGDFSLFRVYSGKDGKPAEYSKDNVPYKPKYFLPISTKGITKEDFTMTFGYPGRTDRYLTSYGVDQAVNLTSPAIVKIRTKKLEVIKKDMDSDDKVRIQYASKYAQTANYWKYFIGQTKGLKRMNVASQRATDEAVFQAWANADPSRKAMYGNALPALKKDYQDLGKYAIYRTYLNEAINRGPEVLGFAYGHNALMKALENKETSKEDLAKIIEGLKTNGESHFKEYNTATDKKLLAELMALYYKEVPKDQHAPIFKEVESKYDGDFGKFADAMFKSSVFVDQTRYNAFLAKPSAKVLSKDLAYRTMNSIMDHYNSVAKSEIATITSNQAKSNRLYVAGLREMSPDKKFAPDANSTMRLSYGTVKDYYPMDGVYYNYFTTTDGILEKMDNSNEEFNVDSKLETLIRNKNFGPYGQNGKLNVCFISNNDITGGNSGSPVINGNGELVGLAFDGNWEAMSGDIAFDADYKRTISVDIRYVLFIIDKYAGAGHLIKEMKLVN
ncbi:MAG: S46 family peptidase [Bacteroidota bacterium]|nr:S46 family peptidase [Bacteroidota bacterium]